jgi:hypothetical protein
VDAAGNESDCTAPLSYTHDTIAPAAPSGLATNPVSPSATDTTPRLTGTVAAGAGAPIDLVNVFKSANCTGPSSPATEAELEGAGVELTVGANQTTQISVTARDGAGNVSACSAPLGYTHDSIAPAAPAGLATTPASPADNPTPALTGDAEAGSTVRIFTAADCTGASTSHTAAALAAGVGVAVPDDSTTQFSATATDAAGNTSPCSAPVTYVELPASAPPPPDDTTPPETEITKAPKRSGSQRRVRFALASPDPGATFECRFDRAAFKPCAASLSKRVRPGRHMFEARAIDAVGNVDPTPARARFKVVAKR